MNNVNDRLGEKEDFWENWLGLGVIWLQLEESINQEDLL